MVDEPDSDELRRARDARRRDVVRRLLARGLSPRLIVAMIPEFEDIVHDVDRERRDTSSS
jgi:hypothetical protein